MIPKQWLAIGALASMPFSLAAQPAPARPDPLDVNAAVPAPSYKSAFDNYQPAPRDQQPSADKVWRMANDAVGKGDPPTGHTMHTADRSAPAETPAADHSKHH